MPPRTVTALDMCGAVLKSVVLYHNPLILPSLLGAPCFQVTGDVKKVSEMLVHRENI
jgi:hypothetical protein